MIIAEDICMKYRQVLKEVVALKNISLDVKRGEIFGLIGPDGAGKSSLFRILTTLLLPTGGNASVGGYDVVKQYRDVRNIVGYMPGKFSLYQDLSVEENLTFFAKVFNTTIEANYDQVKDIYEQLLPFKNRRAGALSGGMKQKLGLCCALIHRPKVLFLDEPTTGVDPISRKEFWDVLKKLSKDGIAVLVSTPYMDEACLCDRIGLIFRGQLLDVDTPGKLVKKQDKKLVAFKAKDMYRLLGDIRKEPGVYSCFTFGDSLHTTFREKDFSVDEFALSLKNAGYADIEWKRIETGIEDYFMMLTNDMSDGTGY